MSQVRDGRVRNIAVAGLFAALAAASALVSIPIGEVPITLQVFVVVLAGLLLSPLWAGAAMGVYVLAGLIGLPVFAGGTAGVAVLAGPTGGYLVGFIMGAALGSAIRVYLSSIRAGVLSDAFGASATIIAIYLFGWLYLSVQTGMGLMQAAAVGVAPFIGVDALKAIGAVSVAAALRRAGVVSGRVVSA